MEIVSSCPMRVTGFVWQSSAGTYAQTVVVKATFVLEPGECKLAPEQEAICDQDQFVQRDVHPVLVAPSDKVPYKPRADVMLVGHAYAPAKQTVRSLVTKLGVGDFSKSVEVWCDRGFRLPEQRMLEGPRFSKMALDWTRAAGGADTPNPVGMSFDAAPDAFGLVSVPNLQPPKTFVVKRSDTFAPIGYGPIAPAWPGRTEGLGRLSGHISQPGWEERPLPEGLDFAYFQAAPLDQQVPSIRPDEQLLLEHLHPIHSQLVTRLPGVCPRAVAVRASGEREDVMLVADTLWIDSDRGICCVVWRGSIGLRHATEEGRISVSLDEPDADVLDDDLVLTIPPGMVDDEELAAMTMIAPFGAKAKGPAMPFVGASSVDGAPPALRKNDDGALPFGPGGLSGLPPAPIAMGQVTLPTQSPASAPTMQEIKTPQASPMAPPAYAPPPPPVSMAPGSDTAQSVWARGAPNGAARGTNGSAGHEHEENARELLHFVWHDADAMTSVGHCHEAFAKAPRVGAKGFDEAFAAAYGQNGMFVPPTVLLAGELELPFDELEALKAALSTVLPIITEADERLRAAVAVAKDFLTTPGLSAAPGVSDELTARIQEAIVQEKTGLPPNYIDSHMQRALLLGRHYQKREVFGGMFVRCLMWLPGEQNAIVGYLPSDASKKMPLWRRFGARILAEVHLSQDEYEAAPRAVKVLAVARVEGVMRE